MNQTSRNPPHVGRSAHLLACAWIVVGSLSICVATAQDSQSRTGIDRPIERRLTVTGQGEVRVLPDKADISIGVITEERTSRTAASANANAAKKPQDAILKLGIARKDIQTSNYSVQPIYEPVLARPENPQHAQVITGYRVSNVVRATIHDLNRIGDILDAGTAAGSNTIIS